MKRTRVEVMSGSVRSGGMRVRVPSAPLSLTLTLFIMSNYFVLKSMELQDKKVKVKYDDLHSLQDKSSKQFGHNIDAPVIAHPELQSLFDTLTEFLMRSNGYYGLYEEGTKYIPKGEKSEKFNNEFLDLYSRIKVTKVIITRSKEKGQAGAILEGYVEYNGSKNKLETHKILFEANTLGYEGKVRDLMDQIEQEAKELVYHGKCLNPTLPLDGEPEEKPKRGRGRPKKEKATA